MLGRIFQSRPHPELAHTRTALSYTTFELALLSLCAQAIAYFVRTGHWPKLIAHDAIGAIEVWPS